MRKVKFIIITLGIFTFFFSCGKRTKIPEYAYGIIPYKGNETLVFESTNNDRDTIFLKGFDRFMAGGNPLDLFPYKSEIYQLNCVRSDPNPPNGEHRYLEGKYLMELYPVGKNDFGVNFDIIAKWSWYYGKTHFSKNELDSIPNSKISIRGKVYDDVKIIEADGSYSNRENRIERFYWSLNDGLLGWEKKNEKWELIK
ncbi:hypothetical protein ACOSQB_01005 [Tenacibaculum sp. MEBiC07804]